MFPEHTTYHLSCLRAANRELEVCIFFPVSKEEREFGQETVIDVANELDSRWTGVSGDAAFEVSCAGDKCLPSLEVVFVLNLESVSWVTLRRALRLTMLSRSFLISPAASSPW